MYAVAVQVEIDTSRMDEAVQMLEGVIVPTVKAMPGFVSGAWTRSLDGAQGRSFLLFESRDAAQAAAQQVVDNAPPAEAPVALRSSDVFEVLAQA